VNTAQVHRFAHPFYTNTPPAERANVPGVGKQMTDHIKDTLLPFPAPIRNPPEMTLDQIVGPANATAIANAGSITFHACGDTGHIGGGTEDMQEYVADAMSKDYDINHPATSPAFFFHLGDVNYFDNTEKGYQEQFYVPYKHYPGKIIAIAGNHDGETFKYDGTSSGNAVPLEAFIRNFIQPQPSVPPDAGTIYRQMVSHPGVYWMLNAPLVDIIGLYSNVAEGPGYISAPKIGDSQKTWFVEALTKIKGLHTSGERKALVLAVHHPPFSDGSHAGSPEMLADIDDACKKANIMPDLVLAAHSHDYQRYTRRITFEGTAREIPYIVAGGGGRGLSPKVAAATGAIDGDHTYDKSLKDYGYLKITIDAHQIDVLFYRVPSGGGAQLYDGVKVDLVTNRLV
jgi:hypothetical protein